MKRCLDHRDRWGNLPSVWIVAAVVFLLPLIGSTLLHLRMENNLESWLPSSDPDAITFAWYQEQFPQSDRIIVTWEGSTLDDPRTDLLVKKLYGRIDADGIRRGQSPYVSAIHTAEQTLERLAGYEIEADEAVDRLRGILIGRGWIKVRLTSAGSEQRARAERALTTLGQSLGVSIIIHPPLQSVITDGLLTSLAGDGASASADEMAPVVEEESHSTSSTREAGWLSIPHHHLQISWEGYSPQSTETRKFVAYAEQLLGLATAEEPDGQKLIDRCFLVDGSPLGVIIKLSEAGRADRSAAIASIRRAAAECGIPEAQLHLGGQAVVNSALDTAISEAIWNPAAPMWQLHRRSTMLLSGIVGIVLSFLFLRSIRLGLLVIGVSYLSSGLCLAILPLTGSTLNMVLIVMPTLLMTLSLSGAIHVVNYWRFAQHEHPGCPVQAAVSTARQPCLMASLTTAVGLLSLTSSSLLPVRQFGLFSAIGCLISLGIILYLLPSLLDLLQLQARPVKEREGRFWAGFAGWIHRHRRLVYGLNILFFIVCGMGMHRFHTETRPSRYFPSEARVVQDYQYIEENLTGVTPVDAIIRFSPSAQQRLRFLQRLEIVRKIEDRLREHPQITGALCLADFRPVTETPAPTAPRLNLIRYNRTSNEVERQVKSQLDAGAGEYLAVAAAAGDLFHPGDHILCEPGTELWRISAQAMLTSGEFASQLTREMDALIQSETKYHAGVSHLVTGAVPLFLRTQQAVLDGLVISFAGAFVLIACMMIFVLRDPISGLISMLPNLFPVGVVFGLISWSGLAIDIGTMITASVALGIAVDGTLHLLTWYRDSLKHGHTQQEAVAEALAHCGPAMCQTTAVIGLGMFMLFPAELLLVSRFGWLMASLVLVALVGDVLVLPALLSGFLGRLIARNVRRSMPAEEPESTPADAPPVEAVLEVEAEVEEIEIVVPLAKPIPEPHFLTLPDQTPARPRRDGTFGGMMDA